MDLDYRQFKALVKPVLPLAGNDDTLPILTALLIKQRGTTLTATATDRYRLGVCRETVLPGDDFTALVRATDVRRILRIFKPSQQEAAVLRFVVDDAKLTVSMNGGVVDGVESASVTFHLVRGAFPKIDSLFRKALSGTVPFTARAVNPRYLADFRCAERFNEGLVLTTTSVSNIPLLIVHCGKHFLGLLMALDLKGRESLPSHWAEMYGSDPTEVAA